MTWRLWVGMMVCGAVLLISMAVLNAITNGAHA